MIEIRLIMKKAEAEAYDEIRKINMRRNADIFPEMALPETLKEHIFTYNFVRSAICEYHKCLKAEFENQGLEFPELRER